MDRHLIALLFLTVLLAGIGRPADTWAQIDLLAEEPLIAAVVNGDEEEVRSLLTTGTRPDMRARNGDTALLLAARGGNAQIAQLLVDAGANTRTTDDLGDTALHIAAQQGDVVTLGVLLSAQFVDINSANSSGVTPLMQAARYGQTSAVEALLTAGADRDRSDFTGRTAYDWALESRARGLADLLQ